MSTKQFKTNINCSGCVAKVTPVLNGEERIDHWKVDTDNKDKILTVTSNNISEEEIISLIRNTGYNIEPIH